MKLRHEFAVRNAFPHTLEIISIGTFIARLAETSEFRNLISQASGDFDVSYICRIREAFRKFLVKVLAKFTGLVLIAAGDLFKFSTFRLLFSIIVNLFSIF